jgi:hypothetical protein
MDRHRSEANQSLCHRRRTEVYQPGSIKVGFRLAPPTTSCRSESPPLETRTLSSRVGAIARCQPDCIQSSQAARRTEGLGPRRRPHGTNGTPSSWSKLFPRPPCSPPATPPSATVELFVPSGFAGGSAISRASAPTSARCLARLPRAAGQRALLPAHRRTNLAGGRFVPQARPQRCPREVPWRSAWHARPA